MVPAPRRTFSLATGGPFQRLRLRPARLALAAWVPLALGETLRVVLGMAPDPTLLDVSVHTRLLVALPAMLGIERLVDAACRSAIDSLHVGPYMPPAEIDRVVDRGQARLAGWVAEAVILVIALAGGQLALWKLTGPTGVFHGGTGVGPWSFPRLWYVAVALPLVQFVMLRWLWRWGIWSLMLLRLARLPLSALATHPDRAAGHSCLARPISSFGGFVFALAAILSGAWGNLLLRGDVRLRDLLGPLVVFLVATLAVAAGPLLVFSPHLYRLRRRGIAQYSDLATEYVRAFHARWVDPRIPGAGELLGTPDLQSLADLGNSFQVVTGTRLFVFNLRHVLAVWAAALAPMIPLIASRWTIEQVLEKIVGVVLGGLPL
jgi:hypothetical protein